MRTLARWVLFDLHNAIATLPGSTGARELLVRRVLEYVDNLARSARGDPSLQLELASAYARIGDLQWNRYYAQLGDYRGALENQRKALQIREAVAAAEPANPGARLSLAASYMVIGDLLQQAGDHRAALGRTGARSPFASGWLQPIPQTGQSGAISPLRISGSPIL